MSSVRAMEGNKAASGEVGVGGGRRGRRIRVRNGGDVAAEKGVTGFEGRAELSE